jgi:sulfur-carrier protein
MRTEKTGPATTTPGIDAATVRIPGPLRGLAGGTGEVAVRPGTVRAVLDDLVRRHPGLLRHFRTEQGDLREHVNVFVNEEDIRYLDGEGTPVAPGDTVTVVPSIAGG